MHIVTTSMFNIVVVAMAVSIHYEFLFRMTRLLPRMTLIRHRYRIVVGLAGAILAHVLEIWLFALAYFAMVTQFGWGTFEGSFNGHLLDYFYFSFTTYTTLGFGDIQPIGEVRYLTGIESLVGLVLVTWTASFLYLEMQDCWTNDD